MTADTSSSLLANRNAAKAVLSELDDGGVAGERAHATRRNGRLGGKVRVDLALSSISTRQERRRRAIPTTTSTPPTVARNNDSTSSGGL
jgi:hypothetical protein